MKGLELSRRYFETVGRPALEAVFGEAVGRMSIGFAGEGSECLGFDDAISQDHDFSPGFCIWLDQADYERLGTALNAWYDTLPKDFLGYDASRDTPNRRLRVGAFSGRAWFSVYLGAALPPDSAEDWLRLADEQLAAASNGEIFQAGCAEFDDVRSALLRYYPDEVRRRKLAAALSGMARSGQYNYARCMRRADPVAAGLAVSAFIRETLAAAFLLNRRYMPYYKWAFRASEAFSVLRELRPLLFELSEAAPQKAAWSPAPSTARELAVNRRDEKVCLMESCCALVAGELRRQGLCRSDSDFLDVQAHELLDRSSAP